MEEDEFISKTQRKKRMHDVQAMGVALTKLSHEQLARLELPEELREAVLEARRLTRHEAIRRQGQYIGRLMRELDPEPIAAQLAELEAPSARQTALFHLAERWRSDILADPSMIEAFAREFPGVDRERLRELTDAAQKERAAGHSPKRYRELFHAINAVVQERGKAKT